MSTETFVDVAFPLTGRALPLDHGYRLYGAVSSMLPVLHDERRDVAVQGSPPAAWALHPVRGLRSGPDELALDRSSLLKVRMPASRIADVLPIVGKTLDVGGRSITVGVPRIYPLETRAALRARFVTIRHHEGEPEDFASAVKQQLARVPDLGMDSERLAVEIGRRRIMMIAGKKVVGFQVAVDGLEATASVALQVHGIGGRRHMGGGVFVPWGKRA